MSLTMQTSPSDENFTADERQVLSAFFTNVDRPVFAVINLPEVVKGALFARYSRSAKSLRRLFLDEFLGDSSQGATQQTTGGSARSSCSREYLRIMATIPWRNSVGLIWLVKVYQTS
jgi:hypothetical protein